jgi:hypothetical protein
MNDGRRDLGDLDADLGRRYLKSLEQFRANQPTTLWQALAEMGCEPRRPSEIGEDNLAKALERLILAMAQLHVFLTAVEHLSDRALYEELYEECADEDFLLWPHDPNFTVTVSFLCHGASDERQTWLRYYADEDERAMWFETNGDLPAAELPPFPRFWLPQSPNEGWNGQF